MRKSFARIAAAVALVALSGVFAGFADAATVRVNLSIAGAGTVTATGYSCGSANLDERVTTACSQHVVSNDPSLSGVSTTLTAIPRSGGQWTFLRWEGCEVPSGTSCTVSAAPFSARDWNVRAVFDDVAPPTLTSDGESFGDRSVTFYWHSNEPANFFCKLGAGPTEACGTDATFPPGKAYTSLPEGSHTFSLQAFDASGQASTTLQRSVTIVDTVITSGPGASSLSNSRTPTFGYSTVAGLQFECSLDFAAFSACGNGTSGSLTVGPVSDGTHTFRVRAKNGSWVDAVPASRTWTVDATAPAAPVITGGPAANEASLGATFAWQYTGEPATFICQLDGGGFEACSSPKTYGSLSEGSHTFWVKARDAAGNESAAVDRTWTVDTTAPPAPTINSGPSGATNSTVAAFTYSSPESGVTFECALDGAPHGACPASYSSLGEGSHTFSVRAKDAVGNTSPAATRTWTVDTTAPETTIDTAPPSSTQQTTAVFTFSSPEAGSTFACSLDGAPFASCASGQSYTVGVGAHTFQVKATDAAGNQDASPATVSWTVVAAPDVQAPDTRLMRAPGRTTRARTASFRFGSTEAGSTFQCKLDRGRWTTCRSPKTYRKLKKGKHTFQVRAIDAAGNVDRTPAKKTWRVR